MKDLGTKRYLNSIYGMTLSNFDKEKLKEIYHSGETHAAMSKINENNLIVSRDNSICMYDYAKEILDLTEGYADTDSAK